jgi:excinuclease UvrABC nuclease subunit
MKEAAKELQFELAAVLRDEVVSLEKLQAANERTKKKQQKQSTV